MKKRYKAIFGNPPYSIRSEKGSTCPPLLWHKFGDSSIDMAEEVYYITPIIWNGRTKKFIAKHKNRIKMVDLTTTDEFNVGSSICYWNTAKRKGVVIKTRGDDINIGELTDLEYLPMDTPNTLSIHRKAWTKNRTLLCNITNLHSHYDKRLLRRICELDSHNNKESLSLQQDDEFKYKVYHQHSGKIYYTNAEGIRKYGVSQYRTPKVIIGTSSDNTPFMDRHGEYATTQCSYFVEGSDDELDARYKQLSSKFTKFWMITGRQDSGEDDYAGLIYHTIFRLFPRIPLDITSDDDIYKWLELTPNEIAIVEKYSAIAEEKNNKREEKRKIQGYNERQTSHRCDINNSAGKGLCDTSSTLPMHALWEKL